ncbi:hypothetical protein [Paenibacillus tyrfis]|uniref:hypothetical protein n=1 Tax=Paenibacillus tyrfis TaxID=1501230 RepID=UPI0020A12D39|nr:hypothetical protein [Paenibacillus tyrfis]MCP1312112.1 hypothetical protein [Paenibacillus tyrfis]
MENKNRLELNPAQIVVLAAFPDIEKALYTKFKEGYKVLAIKYEADKATRHESLDITLSKDYERFFLMQGKGHYAGGFSHVTFGREGERGVFL